ncbi:MAG: S9 family peptidase [Calditrichaeota bacterium]|nr:MAG: S9 family peptidase [Calditrichota bacterium]
MSKLISRETVTPNKFQTSVINKMFDSSVYDDTLVERITYINDSLNIKGYIVSPKESGTYPLLLWNRGGYKDSGALEDLTAFLILASTARWGYVVVASQYRGNMGGDGKEDWGGKDVDDALAMLDFAAELPNTDMNRIAIEGASRGGMTTYRALAEDHRFKCAMVHAGIADIFELEKQDAEFAKLVDKITKDLTSEEREAKLKLLSGVHIANQFSKDCPILLMHGDADNRIPVLHSEKMDDVLSKLKHPHEFHILKNGGHVSLKDQSYKEADILRKAWLEKYL